VSVLLLDASVWLAALDADDRFHEAARSLVARGGEGTASLAALDLTRYEVANVAVVKWRSTSDGERLDALIRLTCPETIERVDEALVRAARALAAEHGLTVYDAAYVAAAHGRGWTLVSGDLSDLVRPGHAVAPDAALERR
jgi:predicted nucleic acid-binding protein